MLWRRSFLLWLFDLRGVKGGEGHTSAAVLPASDCEYAKPRLAKRTLIILFRKLADVSQINHLAEVLAKNNARTCSSDLFFGFRCFTMDTITAFCFAQSVNAIDAPNFAAPIVEAMEAASPAFILFKHFPLYRKFVFSLPSWIAIKASPETAGLTQLQVILGNQVKEVTTNPDSLKEAPHPIIYHSLLDPRVHKGRPTPNPISLYEEAQALMFGGTDTIGNTLTVGFFHILDQPELYARLQDEVRRVWPNLDDHPTFEMLEPLPLLTATIKESLRITPGVCSPALRVVPVTGTTISGKHIPGGTIVGMSGVFVHQSDQIFADPKVFNIDRWLGKDAQQLEQWLVAFSKGPRSCLGINLAWCEMYIAFGTMLRRFRMTIDNFTEEDLVWRDAFLPYFYGKHFRAWCEPVAGQGYDEILLWF